MVPVILSGGAGTRLWPVSREGHPKPFMKLPDGQSLLAKTVQRAAQASGGGQMLLVTNRDYYFISKDEVSRTLGPKSMTRASFLLEPVGRNTAAAIAAAAHWICANISPDAIMLVLPADHLIEPIEEFLAATQQAAALAAKGKLVTFGIRPSSPATGYGYIQAGAAINGGPQHEVLRFVEKPDAEAAQAYVASGDFLWNSGMFCMSAKVLLRELKEHRPELAKSVGACWEEAAATDGKGLFTELPEASFAAVESISIDYAVMEPSRNLVVLPTQFAWNDIGSWSAVAGLVPQGADANRVHGNAVLLDCADCFVWAEDRMIATIGLRGVMVVDTPDALLVADAGSAQQVKEVVAQLKARGHESYRLHRTVTRPWGTYTVLEGGQGYKIKRIEVKPGAALSLQMHHHRSEHWVVVSGTAKVVCDDREFLVLTNESTYISAGKRHRVENPGMLDLIMIEVQSGAYLGEDDIVRFSDQYGRDTGRVS
ncbi:MAG: mannose-phosphate guanylyltransferase/mannose-6-phosphate isomerase [Ramlibacter sp.]|nr:mannose-phosphate guanylyltransferase/mannose-6-phosphate isomerase [Ramlibacter sp.]